MDFLMEKRVKRNTQMCLQQQLNPFVSNRFVDFCRSSFTLRSVRSLTNSLTKDISILMILLRVNRTDMMARFNQST